MKKYFAVISLLFFSATITAQSNRKKTRPVKVQHLEMPNGGFDSASAEVPDFTENLQNRRHKPKRKAGGIQTDSIQVNKPNARRRRGWHLLISTE